MQAMVFGTSNSLMTKGWVNMVVEEARNQGIHMENRSIGGSSSRYGAFLTAAHPAEAACDAILYDYAIPDHMLLDAGCISARDILGHYLTIVRELVGRGALDKALVLLLPRREDLVHSAVLDQVSALLAELGVAYLDFRPILAGIMAETGMTEAELYLDPRHFVPEVQHRIGQRVLEQLRQPPRGSGPTHGARILAALPPAGYRGLHMEPAVSRSPCTYGSSLISFPAHELQPGESMGISGASYLIGALIWTHDTAGSVTIHGNGAKVRLHLRRSFRNIFLFDSLTAPLELGPEAMLVAANDPQAPSQKALGLATSRYDHEGATCEIVFLLGCDIPPAEYLALFEQARTCSPPSARGSARQAMRFLRGLLRRQG